MDGPASTSTSTPAPAPTPTSTPRAASSNALPPLLSRLSSPRAAPVSVSVVNVNAVSGNGSGSNANNSGGGAPTTAVASLANRDESMLRVVRRAPDSVSNATTASTSKSTGTASTGSTVTGSAATISASTTTPREAPTSSVSSTSVPIVGGPPPVGLPEAASPLLPPATGHALANPLAGTASGPASIATAPAALTSAARTRPHPPAPPQPLQSSLPSASAQRHIAEARQALDASIANLLDTQLQSRAVLMHNNMRSIEGQQRDLGKAVVGLRKANDGLARLVHETMGPLKEMGSLQNWTEVEYQGLNVIEETLRLAREKRERRERREQAAIEREARREARRTERLEAGLGPEDGGESDGDSSDSGSYWSSSYYSGSSGTRSRSQSRSRSRSRSHSTSRQGSPSRGKTTASTSSDIKGKGKAKLEDIVENVRAMPSSSSSKRKDCDIRDNINSFVPKAKAGPKVDFPLTALDKGKGKEVEVDVPVVATTSSIQYDTPPPLVDTQKPSPTIAETEILPTADDTAEQESAAIKDEANMAHDSTSILGEEVLKEGDSGEPTAERTAESIPIKVSSRDETSSAEGKPTDAPTIEEGDEHDEQIVDPAGASEQSKEGTDKQSTDEKAAVSQEEPSVTETGTSTNAAKTVETTPEDAGSQDKSATATDNIETPAENEDHQDMASPLDAVADPLDAPVDEATVDKLDGIEAATENETTAEGTSDIAGETTKGEAGEKVQGTPAEIKAPEPETVEDARAKHAEKDAGEMSAVTESDNEHSQTEGSAAGPSHPLVGQDATPV